MKYALDEIERRWLADRAVLPNLDTLDQAVIRDKYLDGTRIRLRKVISGQSVTYKLCKKYGKTSPICEPITNIYLSAEEFALLDSLPGAILDRKRYYDSIAGVKWSINITSQHEAILVEAEFGSIEAALATTPPNYCRREVSDSFEYEGATLARARLTSH